MKPRPCKQCRKMFQPKTEWHKFDTNVCKRAWHEAQRRKAMALLKKGRR